MRTASADAVDKSIVKRRLRLGILGTGLAARLLYLPALKQLGHRIELVACANRTRKKAVAYAKLAGIPKVVDTAEELLALPGLDAVLLSLPIDVQPDFVKLALGQGIAVLSEKPVAQSVAVGRRLLKSTSRFDVPWLVGENFHFMSHAQALLQWVKRGRLGDLRMIQAANINKMDAGNPYFHTAWRRKPNFVGGFVVDAGVHLAHVVRLCVGMPTRVRPMTACFDHALSPIDSAVAVLEFDGGLLGTWTSCFSAPYQGPMLRVFGSKGWAELHWEHAVLCDEKGRQTMAQSATDSFRAEFEHFADVVLKGAPVAVPASEALLDLEFMQSIVAGHG